MYVKELFIMRAEDNDVAVLRDIDTEDYKDAYALVDAIIDCSDWQAGHGYSIRTVKGDIDSNNITAQVWDNDDSLWDMMVDLENEEVLLERRW